MTQPKIHRLLGLGLARRTQLDVVDGGDAVKEEEKLDESLAQTRLGIDRESGDDLDAAISLAQTRAATGDVRQTEGRAEASAKEASPVSFAATLIPDDRPPTAEEVAPAESISALMRTMAARAPSNPPSDDSGQALDVSLARTRIADELGPRQSGEELDRRPLSLAHTLPPVDAARSRPDSADSGERASLRRDEAITDDPDLSRRLLKPQGNDARLKDLIRARIFRKKAAPVKIGRYTILDRLGEGGMGVVYTAFDDKLERKIAIKVMRSDNTEGSNGRVRLIREAQAMARLAHPNIVTVHEVGEVDDQVFVAMEYIRGQSLDQWQEEPHPWREVVEVFRQAGRGLAAAHDAGIIHRDFKPHNVLLGDDGTAKVLDFGLARSMTQGQLTDGQADCEVAGPESTALVPTGGKELSLLDQRLTRTGALMGTPAYMAPEQHEGRSADAYSDQFSFCVALYEGLYGELPFEASSLPTLIASVLEGTIKDPPPAAKVPNWLRRVLLRGLAVDPERRFASVSELLTELGRDPVARRRRWLATAAFAGVIGAAGFGAASLSSAQAAVCTGGAEEISAVWGDEQRASVERAIKATGLAYADKTWEMIAPQLDTYAREWAEMRGEACESHQSGKHSERIFDLRTSCLDQRFAEFGALVEILTTADGSVVDNTVDAVHDLSRISTCGDLNSLTQTVPPPEDPDTATAVKEARTALSRAQAMEHTGRFSQGLDLLDTIGGSVESLAYEPLQAEFSLRRGSLYMESGNTPLAEHELTEALRLGISIHHDTVALEALSKRIFLRSYHAQSTAATSDVWLGEALLLRSAAGHREGGLLYNNAGAAYDIAGDVDTAIEHYRRALAEYQKGEHQPDPKSGVALSNIGVSQLKSEDYQKAAESFSGAIDVLSQSLGERHPYVLTARSNLAIALRGHGRLRQAEAESRRTLSETQETQPDNVMMINFMRYHAAATALDLRDFDRVTALLTEVQESASEDMGTYWMLVAEAHIGKGRVLSLRGQDDTAISEHELGLALYKEQAIDPGAHADALDSYGTTLRRAGRLGDSEARLGEALALREEKLPPNTPSLAITLEKLALTYIARGRYDDAEAALSRAATIVADKLPPTSQLIATVRRTTAELELSRGKPAAAVEHARAALSIHEATRDADDGELALTRFALARTLDAQTPASAEARTLATAALEVLRARGEGWAPEAERVDAWLKRL